MDIKDNLLQVNMMMMLIKRKNDVYSYDKWKGIIYKKRVPIGTVLEVNISNNWNISFYKKIQFPFFC